MWRLYRRKEREVQTLAKMLLLVTTLTFGWQAALWAVAHGWISHTAASGGGGIILVIACALGGLGLGGLLLLSFDGQAAPTAYSPQQGRLRKAYHRAP